MKEVKLTELTEDQLREFINICVKEIEKRQEDRKEQLVDNFKKAYEELRKEGIEIYLRADYDEELFVEFDDLSFD